MSPAHPNLDASDKPPGPWRRRRPVLVACALVGLAALLFIAAYKPHDEAGHVADSDYLIIIAAWAVLGLGYAWMRYRPRKPYDAVAVRPRAEAFQGKRWRLLTLLTVYLAVLLIPLTTYFGITMDAKASLVERAFYAILFLAPCALTVGLMTSAIYSRGWGAVVDDELTVANRASAFRLGFMVFLAGGAAAYATTVLRPDLALAVMPAAIGAPVCAAGLRFALLERRAALTDG